jgi:uncharacterized protein (TIGR02421 family)
MLSKRIHNFDNFFAYVSSVIESTSLSPINATSEKLKFLKMGKNPVFCYKSVSQNLLDLRCILTEIKFGKSDIELVYEKKRLSLINKIDLNLRVGTNDFSVASQKIYPAPDDKLVKTSYEILKLVKAKRSKRISRVLTIKLIKNAFAILGIKNWKIASKDIVTSAQVQASTRTFFLRKNERFYASYVKRLIVHEIGTHVVRYENGNRQMLRIFSNGFSNRLETEEGLAVYSEFAAGLLTTSMLRNYAGRVVAVNFALNHGFKATYTHLCKYFKPKTALKLTSRVKRGLMDTSKKGAYTKDVIYLRGFFRVFEYVESGEDLSALFVGRIGIEDVSVVNKFEKLGYVTPPEYVPEYFNGFFEQNPDIITKEMIVKLRG